MKILIDTRIISLALKHPFLTPLDPEYELSVRASGFVRKIVENHSLLVSSQLGAEIYHVLTMRGKRLPKEKAKELMEDLLSQNFVSYREITKRILQKAIKLSTATGIHIWDFLVVVPFEGEAQKIYTMDPHFLNKEFSRLAEVENPIGVWKVEGEK
ncbi:MAG: hypothetical protein AB1393_11520 [Candidatus Edwardsbacteria bacterium]